MTCGDVGTKAEEVERVWISHINKLVLYANSFSTLKSCHFLERHGDAVSSHVVMRMLYLLLLVVLLDEADVFLEQRKLDSLERNALVSGKRTLSIHSNHLVLTVS